MIVERLLAAAVTRKNVRRCAIVQREGKHAIELLRRSPSPLLVGVDDDLGIGPRAEVVAFFTNWSRSST